jgi:hypothetical protein
MTIKKTETTTTAETTVEKTTKTTEAQAIWNEIKDLSIAMFGLPDQTVEDYCTFIPIESSRLYLMTRSSAALPALETTLQAHGERAETQAKKTGAINKSQFSVELVDKYIVVARLTPKLTAPKK